MKTISLFNIEIQIYLLFILLSLFINAIICIFFLENTNIGRKHYLGLIILETIGICLGAKILDFMIYYKYYTNIIDIFFRGYIFYGGIIGGVLAIYIYSKTCKLNVIEIFNIFIPNIILIYGISKIGCFFNKCCMGINNLPIQLLESILCLITYFILMINRNQYIKEDKLVEMSILSYCITRIILEFFRADMSAKIFIGLSISQIISVLLITNLIYLKYIKLKKKKTG